MGLDIRIPLGMIFLLIGGLLTIFGALTRGSAIYDRSLGLDINLVWGVVLVVFGLVMLWVGRRQRWQDDPVTPRPWERRRARAQQ